MVVSVAGESVNGYYDWAKQVKEFEDTKAGVKGLVDSGVERVPEFFIHKPDSVQPQPNGGEVRGAPLDLPIIDLQGVESGGARRREVVEEMRKAASTWGFFRMVNHGIPVATLDAMLEATRRFHEQPTEAKRELYSSDGRRSVRFTSNVPTREFDPACWRDLLSCVFRDDAIDDPEALPPVCRNEVQEYVKYLIKLRETMAELLSEALGLSSDYLSRIECMKSESLAFLYYPACPQPDLTVGNSRHSDPTFLTVLLQDTVGGLQILHDNQWVDVPPVHGSLIANIGDLMQIISNDKFKSVEHKVRAQRIGPRVSVACFFTASTGATPKPFGPIKELLSNDSPPVYREFHVAEYISFYKTTYGRVASALPHFKLSN